MKDPPRRSTDFRSSPIEPQIQASEAALRAEIETLRRRVSELETQEGAAGASPAGPAAGPLPPSVRELLDCMTDGVVLQRLVRDEAGRGVDSTILWANRAFEGAAMATREDVLDRRVSEVLPEDAARLVPFYERLCDTGDPVQFEHLWSANGRWYRMSAFSRGADAFMSVFADVTEEHETLEALLRSEERYRSLLDSISDAVYLLDHDYRYLMVNDRAADDVQMPREKLIGGVLFELFPGLEQTAFFTKMKAVMENRVPDTVESPYQHPDGRFGHYELRIYPVPDGILCIATDVTTRKRLESDLRHAEKMKAVGQLAGGVAHDFNNQLAGITGYAEMLRRVADVDPLLRKYADGILNAAKRASDLTSQLLAFSRKGKNLTQRCDVAELVDEVVGLLGRSIDKRIAIRAELSPGRPCVEGDPTQIQNAVLNLALNARDAMPDGGTLTFRTEIVDLAAGECVRGTFELQPGPHVAISVIDTGAGLDEATRERIFEPFFTTKPEGEGTGMGLAAVYGTATSHHGAVECESRPRRGSTFRLLLPRVECAPESGGRTVDARPHLEGAGRRILVIDDEEIVRNMTRALLSSNGYDALAVAGGYEAIEYLRDPSEVIDLVILDMVMPGLNGRETYRRLQEVRPGIPVVLCSGFGLNGEAQELLDEGVSAFLTKPFAMDELIECLEGILNPG